MERARSGRGGTPGPNLDPNVGPRRKRALRASVFSSLWPVPRSSMTAHRKGIAPGEDRLCFCSPTEFSYIRILFGGDDIALSVPSSARFEVSLSSIRLPDGGVLHADTYIPVLLSGSSE